MHHPATVAASCARELLRRWFVPVVAILVFPATVMADDAWRHVKTTRDGIKVSRRPGQTSGFHVLRLEAICPVAPERLSDFVWDGFREHRTPVQKREFLVRRPDEMVFHDQVKTRVVSDREYTMRVRRQRQGSVFRLVFQTAPEAGPPPNPGFVTIPIVQGSWEFRPEGTGSAITYTVYSEPGGSVPAFIVRGAQMDEALEDVRDTLKEAAQLPREP
jgi:hypothetical protein